MNIKTITIFLIIIITGLSFGCIDNTEEQTLNVIETPEPTVEPTPEPTVEPIVCKLNAEIKSMTMSNDLNCIMTIKNIGNCEINNLYVSIVTIELHANNDNWIRDIDGVNFEESITHNDTDMVLNHMIKNNLQFEVLNSSNFTNPKMTEWMTIESYVHTEFIDSIEIDKTYVSDDISLYTQGMYDKHDGFIIVSYLKCIWIEENEEIIILDIY